MNKQEQRIIERVTELATPVLQEEALELVQVQYRREHNGWVLRFFIDRPAEHDALGTAGVSGVTVEDCAVASREIGRVLDGEDAVPGSYTLEVSSPGLDRPLTKPADFERFAGRQVTVKAVGPEGRRKVKGRLIGLADATIRVEADGAIQEIPYADAQLVRLVPEIEW